MDVNGRAAMAGRTRIKLSWNKWRELRGIPTNKDVPRAGKMELREMGNMAGTCEQGDEKDWV